MAKDKQYRDLTVKSNIIFVKCDQCPYRKVASQSSLLF